MPGEVAAPAATNGAHSPQTPTPAAAPTAKNGEGAVVQTPAKVEPPKPKQLRKVKFGDGAEDEYDPSDLEAADRRYIASKALDRASKDRAAAQRELERVAKLAQENPEEFLRHFKHDPKKLVEKWAREELARLEMTDEQRKVADESKARQSAEAKAAALERQVQQFLQRQQLDAQWAKEKPEWEAALTKRNRIGDDAYIDLTKEVRTYLEDNQIPATIEQICALTDDEWGRRVGEGIEKTPTGRLMESVAKRVSDADVPGILKALGPKLTPKALWESLPDDAARKAVGDLLLAWHRGVKAKPAQAPAAKPQQAPSYRTEAEWKASRK